MSRNKQYGRRPKSPSQLRRPKPKREPYDYILIVCEGEKTEPNYLKAIKKEFRLNSVIFGEECGSAPKSVVEFAKEEAKKDNFDKVYCVFDRDQHVCFNQALSMIADMNRDANKTTFIPTVSTPCFEIWVLLHFKYTTKKYTPSNGSFCRAVIKDVKTKVAQYEKGHLSIWDILKDNLEQALKNSKLLRKHCKTSGDEDPYTDMDILVEQLISLKEASTK